MENLRERIARLEAEKKKLDAEHKAVIDKIIDLSNKITENIELARFILKPMREREQEPEMMFI